MSIFAVTHELISYWSVECALICRLLKCELLHEIIR